MRSEEKIEEVKISKAIIEVYMRDLLEVIETDVAIVGAGPAGMTAAYYLAKAGIKTVVFERKLSVGGGMWGGGMMFPRIVVQEEGKRILEEFGISTEEYKKGYWVADAVETVSTIASRAIKAGARIFNLISVEDVMIKEDERVCGLVLNWSAVELANLHVDPLTIKSRFVIDATGHECGICRIVCEKAGKKLNTPTGGIMGEKQMWAEVGERDIIDNTREVYPGLVVAGMAANVVFGSPRMGAIFGGMLLSGKKAAEIILCQP
ncbi:MAG: sulfide-dependent adenosine diphosphate thiazole synthase [Candidatus Methanospirareceae archaeon]